MLHPLFSKFSSISCWKIAWLRNYFRKYFILQISKTYLFLDISLMKLQDGMLICNKNRVQWSSRLFEMKLEVATAYPNVLNWTIIPTFIKSMWLCNFYCKFRMWNWEKVILRAEGKSIQKVFLVTKDFFYFLLRPFLLKTMNPEKYSSFGWKKDTSKMFLFFHSLGFFFKIKVTFLHKKFYRQFWGLDFV